VTVCGWAVLVGVLVAVGDLVVRSSAVAAFDQNVTSAMVAHRSPGLDAVMKAVTWLGSWVALAVAGAILIVLTARRSLPVLGLILAVVAWGGESLGVALVKHAVQRQRPPQDVWLVTAHGWSWPSGHTAVAAVLFFILAMTLSYLTANRLMRATVWITAAAGVGLVGFSRIELGVHWATDVIASVVFVSLWLALMVTSWASTFRRHPSHGGGQAGSGVSQK
jgi:undecaprenyl-diphosphatase